MFDACCANCAVRCAACAEIDARSVLVNKREIGANQQVPGGTGRRILKQENCGLPMGATFM